MLTSSIKSWSFFFWGKITHIINIKIAKTIKIVKIIKIIFQIVKGLVIHLFSDNIVELGQISTQFLLNPSTSTKYLNFEFSSHDKQLLLSFSFPFEQLLQFESHFKQLLSNL